MAENHLNANATSRSTCLPIWQKTTRMAMPQVDPPASLNGRNLIVHRSFRSITLDWHLSGLLPYREARVSSCGREPLQCQCHNLIPVPPYMAENHSNANATTWYLCLPIWQKSTLMPMPQLDTCASLYGRNPLQYQCHNLIPVPPYMAEIWLFTNHSGQ